MSTFWKPTILVLTALILLGAMYIRQPAQSSAMRATATTVVDPNEYAVEHGVLRSLAC